MQIAEEQATFKTRKEKRERIQFFGSKDPKQVKITPYATNLSNTQLSQKQGIPSMKMGNTRTENANEPAKASNTDMWETNEKPWPLAQPSSLSFKTGTPSR